MEREEAPDKGSPRNHRYSGARNDVSMPAIWALKQLVSIYGKLGGLQSCTICNVWDFF